jgi:phosphatidylinositol glycan class V
MTAVAFMAMHVHVATRFLSSSPLLYWHVAAQVRAAPRGRGALVAWAWALSFCALGAALFPKFYPWTRGLRSIHS